jgi:hypothetical protein
MVKFGQHCGQQDKQGGQEVHREERRPGNTRTKEDYERDKLTKAARTNNLELLYVMKLNYSTYVTYDKTNAFKFLNSNHNQRIYEMP